jgi:uncharacterized iron-regulated membrane protein
MVVPEILGVSLTNPWVIGGVVVVVVAIVGGVLWWLHKEGKIKLPF